MSVSRIIVLFCLSAVLPLAPALSGEPALLVTRDYQPAYEREGYAAFLGKRLAAHARKDGYAALGALLEDIVRRNEATADEHRLILGSGSLADDLKQAAGAAGVQHQLYAEAAVRARGIGDTKVAEHFETLARQAAADRDALDVALKGRLDRSEASSNR